VAALEDLLAEVVEVVVRLETFLTGEPGVATLDDVDPGLAEFLADGGGFLAGEASIEAPGADAGLEVVDAVGDVHFGAPSGLAGDARTALRFTSRSSVGLLTGRSPASNGGDRDRLHCFL